MTLKNLKFALNAIQWINVKEDPADPNSANLWRYADPHFVNEYPDVLAEIHDAGFSAAMMEVLDTQTLQNYRAMLEACGLEAAPGYLQVRLPSDHGVSLQRGSSEWIHWFDLVRRRAEESNFMGLRTVFLAAEVDQTLRNPRMGKAAAVGCDFDRARLDECVEMLTAAAEVLRAEGIHAGLHNHVGTWVETELEIDYVLDNVDPDLLGASFDIGHLEWAGIDAPRMITKYADRIVDLHIKDLDLALARESREHPAPYFDWSDRGLFLEPGLGEVDIVGALRALPVGFDGWVIVEVDRASMDPSDSARVTARWVAELD